MTAPGWLTAAVADFGRAAGLETLALNNNGAAALRFENGSSLRLEYTGGELVIAMTVHSGDVRRLLSISNPNARFGFRIRTGILPKSGEAIIAIRLSEREATLAQMNAAFAVLWRLAGEIGGGAWA